MTQILSLFFNLLYLVIQSRDMPLIQQIVPLFFSLYWLMSQVHSWLHINVIITVCVVWTTFLITVWSSSAWQDLKRPLLTCVAPSHKTSLNSWLADKRYQLNSRWGSISVIFTLLQKCIIETLNYDVVVIFCLINGIQMLKLLLRQMCKSTKTHNTKNVQGHFLKMAACLHSHQL